MSTDKNKKLQLTVYVTEYEIIFGPKVEKKVHKGKEILKTIRSKL